GGLFIERVDLPLGRAAGLGLLDRAEQLGGAGDAADGFGGDSHEPQVYDALPAAEGAGGGGALQGETDGGGEPEWRRRRPPRRAAGARLPGEVSGHLPCFGRSRSHPFSQEEERW